jgi:DNA-binding NtrC family response regulator
MTHLLNPTFYETIKSEEEGKMQHKVLFVDDEPSVIKALKRAFHKESYEILTADSAEEALEILERESVDVVVSDEQMPGMTGCELLAIVCKRFPDTIRIILTGHASLEVVIRAINEGQIYRFFTKPWNDVDLAITIRQALQQKDLIEESRRLLKTARHQSTILQELEKEHPELTSVRRDVSGRILVEDEDYDFDALIEQMTEEIRKVEEFLSQPVTKT